MALHFFKQKEPFWPVRKLLMTYLLLYFPKELYTVDDVCFPVPPLYQREAVLADRVLEELLELTTSGITLKDIQAGLALAAILQILGISAFTFTHTHLRSLPRAAFCVLAPLVSFSFEFDENKQQRALKNYVKKYAKGKLISQEGKPVFGYDFVEKLLEHVVADLVRQQGRDIQLTLSGDRYDLFATLFAEYAPKEYQQWQMGNMKLPMLEHVLGWIVLQQRIELIGFETKPSCKLFIRTSSRKPKAKRGTLSGKRGKITLVEVIAPDGEPSLTVYLNQDYLHPFTFRKASKTGQIIYHLAQEGSIEWSGYEKIYEYFFQYDRFSFFKRGRYLPTPLLAKHDEYDSDGELTARYIIPHQNVVFRVITEKDIT